MAYQNNASIAHVNANSRERIGKVFHSSGLKTAESWEVLVKTGLGVKGIRVGRTFYLWPGQRVSAVNMKPRNISFNLHRQGPMLVYQRLNEFQTGDRYGLRQRV